MLKCSSFFTLSPLTLICRASAVAHTFTIKHVQSFSPVVTHEEIKIKMPLDAHLLLTGFSSTVCGLTNHFPMRTKSLSIKHL